MAYETIRTRLLKTFVEIGVDPNDFSNIYVARALGMLDKLSENLALALKPPEKAKDAELQDTVDNVAKKELGIKRKSK